VVRGGCGQTALYKGPIPVWLDQAAGNNTPTFLPYAIASPATAGAFIFGYPLLAGHPTEPANKILWVVRTPRQGGPLIIDGHPLGLTAPVVHETRSADSSPGEIYPSAVDVPSAGCWHFTLTWATGRAEVDLEYVKARSPR